MNRVFAPLMLGCLLVARAEAQEPLKLRPAAPCGVFHLGERLRFEPSTAAAPPQSLTVVDETEAVVWTGRAETLPVTLPPLPRGWYELRWTGEGDVAGSAAFAIVSPLPDEDPADGPVGVDTAMDWLSKPEEWTPIARMLRRIGVGTARERLSWGEVAREPDSLAWGRYETVAEALANAGVRNYQIFHDSPGWSHPGAETKAPDDLRTVYRFVKEAAAHFLGRVIAWEPWNEPDIGFFDQPGDRMAGIQKAAYLGAKAGNPEVLLLQVSLCAGRSNFADNLYECGIADYVDAFNFHTYDDIRAYAETIERWIAMPEAYGIGALPIWLTEAGIRLPATRDGRELTLEQERIQAQFLPKSYAISLAGGVDKHFFFVLPWYLENGVQFGALREGLEPRPAIAALATTARLLGQGRYLGRLPVEGPGARALLFDSGKGLVAVVWAEEETDAALEAGADLVTVTDYLGRESYVRAGGEAASLHLGPVPQFVSGLGASVRELVTEGPRRAPGATRASTPSPVVLCGRFGGLPVDKAGNYYRVPLDRPSPFEVEVVNLDETAPAKGTVRLTLPEGWTADRTEAEVDLTPMGRELLRFAVTPRSQGPLRRQRIGVEGEFEGTSPAPSVSHASPDVSTAQPTRSLSLEVEAPDRWRANVSGNGSMEIEAGPEGGVRFAIRFTAPGDRWAYPVLDSPAAGDWSGLDALRFEYRTDTGAEDTTVRVQLAEESGSLYCSSQLPASTEWRKATVAFQDLAWGSYSPADANGRLDTDAIRSLLIGLNTPRDAVSLEVRALEVVGFRGK